jgi:DNA-binding NtrC family response regulator
VKKRIIVATPNLEAVDAIRGSFEDHEVIDVQDAREALRLGGRTPVAGVFIDVTLLRRSEAEAEYKDYRDSLQMFWRTFPGAQIVAMAPPDALREVVKVIRAGVADYVTYPVTAEMIGLARASIDRAALRPAEPDQVDGSFWHTDAIELVRTSSPAMKAVLGQVRQVAPTRSTVLITGETGTGKSLFARILHQHSNRRDHQFIKVSCGAIPETLLEAELFGHEKGAFTGAGRRKLGRFEVASGGTIFLDEVGALSPAMQVKLLQVLQDQTIERVGGESTIHVDVRILAATNADLERAVEESSFRADLFYRLNVFSIEMPPLRDRLDDIEDLVDLFIGRLDLMYGKSIKGVHPAVVEAFHAYAWPGNVRELESVLERAYILATTDTLQPESFPERILSPPEAPRDKPGRTLDEVRRSAVDRAEQVYLRDLLLHNAGSIAETARSAGISVRQLHNLMTRHGLRKEDFKKPAGKK